MKNLTNLKNAVIIGLLNMGVIIPKFNFDLYKTIIKKNKKKMKKIKKIFTKKTLFIKTEHAERNNIGITYKH